MSSPWISDGWPSRSSSRDRSAAAAGGPLRGLTGLASPRSCRGQREIRLRASLLSQQPAAIAPVTSLDGGCRGLETPQRARCGHVGRACPECALRRDQPRDSVVDGGGLRSDARLRDGHGVVQLLRHREREVAAAAHLSVSSGRLHDPAAGVPAPRLPEVPARMRGQGNGRQAELCEQGQTLVHQDFPGPRRIAERVKQVTDVEVHAERDEGIARGPGDAHRRLGVLNARLALLGPAEGDPAARKGFGAEIACLRGHRDGRFACLDRGDGVVGNGQVSGQVREGARPKARGWLVHQQGVGLARRRERQLVQKGVVRAKARGPTGARLARRGRPRDRQRWPPPTVGRHVRDPWRSPPPRPPAEAPWLARPLRGSRRPGRRPRAGRRARDASRHRQRRRPRPPPARRTPMPATRGAGRRQRARGRPPP